ncbi:MAG TPA: MFS transporter [Lysobacter sp.]
MSGPPPTAWHRALGLLAVVVLMAVDGINGTLLVVNRGQVMGSFDAIPDEAAWLGVAYLAAKLVAFAWTPWLVGRYGAKRAMLGGGLWLAACTGALAFAPNLDMAVAIRAAQGACGALVLVAGQTLVFQSHATARQPLLQATLALAVLVVPVMAGPALHGWLTDAHDWRATFIASSIAAALACAALHRARVADARTGVAAAPGVATTLLLAAGTMGGVYVMQQGARFDWFDDGRIRLVAVASLMSLLAALWSHRRAVRRFLRRVADHPDFVFGVCASLFAGFALFGSGAAIPLFGGVVLQLGPEHVGQLVLSSSIAAAAGLVLAAALMQAGRIPMAAPIPLGIALFMAGMWLLSLSTAQTGAPQVRLATWLRGFGMGLLFMSLTMITLGGLARELLAGGVALFNTGRQLGGLAGGAFVSSLFEWRQPVHATALAQHLQPGSPALEAAQPAMAGVLVERGVAAGDAASASMALLARQLQQQAGARAFDEIFLSLSMFFLLAIPVLVGTKVLLSRGDRR